MTVPHRFDLDNNSCVNTKIQMYNRRLTKVTKHLNKVTVVNTMMERKFFYKTWITLECERKRNNVKGINNCNTRNNRSADKK